LESISHIKTRYIRGFNLSFWGLIFSSILLYWLYKKQKNDIEYEMNSQWGLADKFNNASEKNIVSVVRKLLWKRDLDFWHGIKIYYDKSPNGHIERIFKKSESPLPFSLSDFFNNLDDNSLNSVKEIYIDDRKYANEIIQFLPLNKFRNLEEIILIDFNIDSKSIDKLSESSMPSLKHLTLKNVRLNDLDLKKICESDFFYPRLEKLDLSGNSITDFGVSFLENSDILRGLRSIRLRNNWLISNEKLMSHSIFSKIV
jgi:hypothetical protein